ncbi:MAG TPA: hypothetical protein VMN56_21665, partial [Casimicrobiaceae bacterium]|nr:hypothetical protein [Casimicrobiaceae bacterium]
MASVAALPDTVIGALAGGALPPLVLSAPVVFVTVPGVDELIVTTIVQPPGGIAEPLDIVTVVDVTLTPVHVPVLPLVVLTPAGIVSTNADESVSGVEPALPKTSVSVAAPPGAIVEGAMAFVSVGPAPPDTVMGALPGGAVPPLVASDPVVLVTVPGVDEVMATTIVQPPGGIVEPLAMVIDVEVTATPVHVPVLPPVVVMPAGMLSTKAAVSVSAAELVLPSVRVSVAVPPGAMVAGAIALVSVGPGAVTVIGALAGGAVPPFVASGPVTLVTVPGVDDVIVTTIVQPPTGIAEPLAIVIVVDVTMTPPHVPVLPPVVVTPAGMLSTNADVSVSGPDPVLPSVRVSVAVPPAAMVDGAIALASVGPGAVTVNGALAGGALPPLVSSEPVVFVTVPGVEDVTATTMVQLPGGSEDPLAIVTLVEVTVTPAHVPVFPPVVVTPDGIVSTNGDVSVTAEVPELDSLMVSVAVPPAAMDDGAMALASPTLLETTVSGALAGGAPPKPVVSAPVVLVTLPAVADVIGTMIVQPPTGTLLPDGSVIEVKATVTPAHVPEFDPLVVIPAGIESVNAAVSVIGTALELPIVMVSVAVPRTAIDAGTIVLASVGAVAVTVTGAVAGGAVPASVTRLPVVLFTVPGVLDVTVTTIVQPPGGTAVPLAMVIDTESTVTFWHVPLLPLVVVTPVGIASVNALASVTAVVLTLPIVIVSVAAPPTAMLAGTIVLPSVGIAAVTVNGALAGEVVPAVVTSGLVVLVTVPGVADVTVTTIVQPPTWIGEPLAIVMVVAVLLVPAQVPPVPPVIVTPPGIPSVKAEVSVMGIAFALPRVIVSVALVPATIV